MIHQDALRGLALAVVVGAAILSSSTALAAPPATSHEMQAALAKARAGAAELRRYVERTKPIYALDFNTVMAVAEQQAMASVDAPRVATAAAHP